jgi:hypothetical protein
MEHRRRTGALISDGVTDEEGTMEDRASLPKRRPSSCRSKSTAVQFCRSYPSSIELSRPASRVSAIEGTADAGWFAFRSQSIGP